jgi:hypothetical protein
MRQQLEKMFPMSRPEAITNAIEKSVNVHEAVDILLGSTVEETGLIYTTGHQIMMSEQIKLQFCKYQYNVILLCSRQGNDIPLFQF